MSSFFMETTPEPEVVEKKKSVSFSQFSTYTNCPLNWKLQYVDGFKDTSAGIAAIFGSAMHNTIQEWLKIHYEDAKKAKMLDMNPVLKDNMVKELAKNTIPATDSSPKIFPCTQEEFTEHYDDGCFILDHVKKFAKDFFPTKKHRLVGIEIKLEAPTETNPNIHVKGFIDLIIHDEVADIYRVIDLKTSIRGWYDSQKKDPAKVNQVLIYKYYYSQLFDVPMDKIQPEFIILRRKITEGGEFPMKRLVYFKPSHGKIKMKQAIDAWNKFINEVYDADGNFTGKAVATPGEKNCRYCKFKFDKEKCKFGYYRENSKMLGS